VEGCGKEEGEIWLRGSKSEKEEGEGIGHRIRDRARCNKKEFSPE
jgi:hypothetical protein